MIIVLRSEATDGEVDDVCHRIVAMGYSPHTIRGALRTVIGAVGDDRGKDALRSLESLECVESVTPILKPYKLASREVRQESTQVRIGDVTIGGRSIVVMAGPCAVESRLQLLEAAEKVKAAGAHILRGGAFKPRTSPYAFQGLEDEGLKLQPLVLEPLERVGRGAGLEGAAAQDVGARGLHLLRGLEKLQARLHRTRSGHDDDRPPADRHVTDADLGRLLADLPAGELVGLEDRRDGLDALEGLEAAERVLAAIVADRADHGPQCTADRVGAVAHRHDPMADVVHLAVRGFRSEHDDHDWLLCSGGRESGADRGWPDTDATRLRSPVLPGSARPFYPVLLARFTRSDALPT